jgi:hypothetical protein
VSSDLADRFIFLEGLLEGDLRGLRGSQGRRPCQDGIDWIAVARNAGTRRPGPDMIDSCQGKKAVFLPFNREKKGVFLDALPGH